MEFKTLKLEHEGRVLVVTLNRPESLNAISATMLRELKALFELVGHDRDTSVVLVKSTGKAFSVGYDLKPEDWVAQQYPADHPHGVDIGIDRRDIHELLNVWLSIWRQPKPVITQVHGACISGANELLAVSDLVVASTAASFGHPAGRDLGLPPTIFFWPLLMGMKKTREMLYTAKMIDAEEALAHGLINRVTTPEDLDHVTMALAQDMARTPMENLIILKQAANAWYENMGLFASCASTAEFDAVFHQSESFKNFFRLVQEQGMKAALADRAARFG
ncbi:MAG: enoyl-CoA hydratase/isomerase family protein [Hyphomonadaceae bacterium]|nr:enoyl-CoA hydratase/isomerase family protein [Hyphomonadaceae bacterium]